MRARVITPLLLAASVYAIAGAGVLGCAAFDAVMAAAVPIARVAMGAVEALGCQLHTNAGIPEADPRAVVVHEAGSAVDRLSQASTPNELAALAAAVRAFEGAVEEITGGIPVLATPASLPSSVLPFTDAGTPAPDAGAQ